MLEPQAARFWRTEDRLIHCVLCPHNCRIAEGHLGKCGIRLHREGRLWAQAYGRISALALDPIEKKPLYHVRPGTQILSLGSAGCNFRCAFCQNWSISQEQPALSELAPATLLQEARASGACGAAYTYNEPLINFEYVGDCARVVRGAGLLNVLVSNGYIQAEPLAELLPCVDAWNIDVKSMREEYYRRLCGATLAPVLETVAAAVKQAHVELTYLIVTGENDSREEIGDFVDWVAGLSPEIPVHFSRYFPQYKLTSPATPVEALAGAVALAKTKLHWVYSGNVPGSDDSTVCPQCGQVLIERHGYTVGAQHLQQNACDRCGRKVPGIF